MNLYELQDNKKNYRNNITIHNVSYDVKSDVTLIICFNSNREIKSWNDFLNYLKSFKNDLSPYYNLEIKVYDVSYDVYGYLSGADVLEEDENFLFFYQIGNDSGELEVTYNNNISFEFYNQKK